MNFKALISKVNSWADLKGKFASLSKQDKGLAFEELTKCFLKIDTRYKDTLKHVWLLRELPTAVRKKLNLPSNDQGIDLIAETKEGTYWAIQCKYLQEENQRLSHRAISTFTSLSKGIAKNITHCLVATTADDYATIYKGNKNIGFINADEWNKLNRKFFTRLRALLSGKAIIYKPASPRKHQIKAIVEAKDYFLKQGMKRGKLVFPCGAGKSLTGYWLKRELKSSSTIVAVPSLSLVKQTLEVYLREAVANKEKIDFLCVCSDEGIGKNDDVVVHTSELGVPCVTDVKYIAQWLKDHSKSKTVIFTTYQSGKTIAQAARLARVGFDMGIMDEAHKTVGSQEKLFSHLLFDRNIRIARRIFMTATERRYAGSSDDILSMDDAKVYGETFTQMPFKEAIGSGILSDYKIITLFISDSEVKNLISKNAFVKPQGKEWDKETEARTLAAMIALRKAMMKFPIHHAVTFHSSIKKAEAFEQSQEIFSKAFPSIRKVDSFHVSGAMATSHRSKVIREFSSSRKAIITNAKCLTEGVDVPNIDCVLFADPRKSTVDVVQAVGRALRRTEGKKFGYVILPVFTKSKKKEEIIESAEFKEILTTLRSLASNDERIIEYFRDKSKGRKSGVVGGDLVQFDIDERIIESIDEINLIESLQLKSWDKLAKLSWMPFEEAREYVRELKLKKNDEWRNFSKSEKRPRDMPSAPDNTYRKEGWISWSDFLGNETTASFNKSIDSFMKARELSRSLGLKNLREWNLYCKSDKRNKLILPSNPQVTFKKYWKGWGDFLGTGNESPKNIKYESFYSAQRFARGLGLKSNNEWKQYTLNNTLPKGIPRAADAVYKEKGWKSWGDFLGTGTIAPHLMSYRNFSKARTFARKLRLNSIEEWNLYCKSGKKPPDIPNAPHLCKQYQEEGWISWADFLGTDHIATSKKTYMPFEKAKKYVRTLKLKSFAEWSRYCKSSSKHPEIPYHPERRYKDSWKGFEDFLGIKYKVTFMPYDDARNYARKLGVNTSGWRQLVTSGKKPREIPSNPDKTYLNKGWKGWADFLGNGKK
jgi:superfamily II DNA or RNA helicase